MLKMTSAWHMKTSLSTELHNKYVQGVNRVIEALRNSGIKFARARYIERTSVGNTECSSSVCLYSVMLVSVR
jgi:hypothetical protein